MKILQCSQTDVVVNFNDVITIPHGNVGWTAVFDCGIS